MRKSKSILLHFYDLDDLFHGIEVLQHHKVPIFEVYMPKHVYGIEFKLQIKKIRLGYSILKYGCLGGVAFSSLGYCLFATGSSNIINGKSLFSLFLNLLIITVTYFFSTRLFPGAAPKLIKLKRHDNKYLMVVKANSIVSNEDIICLFKYAEAVEISSAIKDMITA
ncbi:DUF3341 domain-containing protein [Pedobacter hiemivivus]|uniref:DUF3341 domain-containing protein n=1 Tax=Pedobacter hiemivivus TaxID=2530454 RepID=A0A4U1GE94_9SPHI|nr:quinol:electron acceptor oxidoreductase subunit ActD [Pedobacter hiemivivus]TKC62387.1 DUF3341 domain-containing protein [Pedobacter hiemivivus]